MEHTLPRVQLSRQRVPRSLRRRQRSRLQARHSRQLPPRSRLLPPRSLPRPPRSRQRHRPFRRPVPPTVPLHLRIARRAQHTLQEVRRQRPMPVPILRQVQHTLPPVPSTRLRLPLTEVLAPTGNRDTPVLDGLALVATRQAIQGGSGLCRVQVLNAVLLAKEPAGCGPAGCIVNRKQLNKTKLTLCPTVQLECFVASSSFLCGNGEVVGLSVVLQVHFPYIMILWDNTESPRPGMRDR